MFGYVKPNNSELLVKEYEFYKATYCGICRSMKHKTGFLSNTLHSYDSVFLALVRMLWLPDEAIGVRRGKCVAHPLKAKYMLRENEATDYAAAAFGILTYYKLCDDMQDEKIIKKLATSLLKPIFSGAKRRASIPSLADIVKGRLDEITALEAGRCRSVDEPAKLFGELLGEIFAYGFEGADRIVLYETGFHLGKFIYSADAAEDYEKDRKSGSYNPYVLLYDGAELTGENKATIKSALIFECRELEKAINLLPFGNRITIENIISNIIYLGLPKRIEFLDGDKKSEDSAKDVSPV